jgi:predicted dehydrogenase
VIVTAVAGGQGGKFARLAHASPTAYVTAVVEAFKPEDGRRLADELGVPYYGRIEDAIADRVPYELGVLCGRPNDHEREVTCVLEDGKSALCEKPPTDDLPSMRRVRRVEAQSRGFVRWAFQLAEQYKGIAARVAWNEFGPPRLVKLAWERCLVSNDEAAREFRAGKRRGETGRPMEDLCHMVQAGIGVLPPGVRVESVIGHSWESRDWMSAAISYPWQGGRQTARIVVAAGWDVVIPALKRRERVSLELFAAAGYGGLNFLVDDALPGSVVPEEYYPQLVTIEPDGAIRAGSLQSPMPETPDRCRKNLFEDTVRMLRAGERPPLPADGGLEVMQLLDGWRRSSELGGAEVVMPEDDC